MSPASQHTPRPWHSDLDDVGYTVIRDEGGRLICQISGRETPEETSLNEALITAAPNMLAALVAVVPQLDPEARFTVERIIRDARGGV